MRVGGSQTIFACGCPGCFGGPGCCACALGGACGYGGSNATVVVTYKQFKPDAPFTCTPSGTADVLADGQWHQVADAIDLGCVAPNNDTTWNCMATTSDSQASVECRMVGSVMQVRVTSTPHCSPCQGRGASLPEQQCDCEENIDSSPESMANAGCLITSLAMGAGLTPCEANRRLSEAGDVIADTGRLDPDMRYERDLGLNAQSDAQSDQDIIDALCRGRLVVAEVASLNRPGGVHYVVVTGQRIDDQGNCEFTINDPACNNPQSTLEDYGGWTHVFVFCRGECAN